MKKLIVAVLAMSAFLVQVDAFADNYSKVTIRNRSEYPFTISKIKEIRGDKVVPTYAPVVPYVGKDLNKPGFRCYFRLANWVCIRQARRQIDEKSLKTKTKTKDITINPGKKKTIFSIDRDQPSIEYVRWWKKKGVKDPEFVPADLRKALSRVYPFEAKRFVLEGPAGSSIEFNIQAERGGSLAAFKAALIAGGLAMTGVLIPMVGATAALIASPTAAVLAAVNLDQKSFLSWKYQEKDLKAKIRFKKYGFGKYKNLEIIIDSVIPRRDPADRKWYEGESGELKPERVYIETTPEDPYITR